MSRPKKTIQELKTEIMAENPAENFGGDSIENPPEIEKKKRGRPRKETEPEITPEVIGAILDMPFGILRTLTKDVSHEIPPDLKPMVIQTGLQVYKDFGADISLKYLNLAAFVLVYGGCLFVSIKKLKPEKKNDGENNNNIRAAGERENQPGEGLNA